uniref:Beta-ketoacyl synthase-like N-terminal domain-containing protein n=1 Tax=Timema cristinae TaxID=61476 RepID=A0A7R9DD11_TIMCR|nr:unnamed protein product [Timema cristinae]
MIFIMPEGNNTEISDEDVVISGIAGSFPEAINTDELKEKLFDNAEFVKICEYSNWGKDNLAVPKFIGRIPGHNSFDSVFFGIHKKQCDDLNSMIRNVLERSYEAIVDAGLSPEDVNNTRMGVMIGSNISESENTNSSTIVNVPCPSVSTSMFEMSVNVYSMSESVSFCLELSRAAISLSPEKGRLVVMCGRAKDTLLCAVWEVL